MSGPRQRARAAGALRAAVLLPALGLTACGARDEMAERFAAAAREGRAVRGAVAGRPVAVLVEECRAYDLTTRPDRKGRRDPVLTTEFYPWFTVCERQHATIDGGYVVVTLGRTAVGAGGCCASGGTYRSRDGRQWEREGRDGRWRPVNAPDPTPDDTSADTGPDSSAAAPAPDSARGARPAPRDG